MPALNRRCTDGALHSPPPPFPSPTTRQAVRRAPAQVKRKNETSLALEKPCIRRKKEKNVDMHIASETGEELPHSFNNVKDHFRRLK